MTDNLMVLGTGSGVGKSMLVTALGRCWTQQGYEVAPFKAQNMSNNATVAAQGGEMAMSQAVQARACRQVPSVHHNPILLKPTSDGSSELIVQGEVRDRMSWREYRDSHDQMAQVTEDSYRQLKAEHDLIVMEGAGSPSEPNLKSHDLVNLPMAERVQAPAIIVGDISRGGVFAWLAGTLEWMTPAERHRIKGVIINRFRGDASLLDSAVRQFEHKYNPDVLGIIPELTGVTFPPEDSLDVNGTISHSSHEDPLQVTVINTPRASNLTDFQPLVREPDVSLEIQQYDRFRGDPDLVILPGTKNTIGDLADLRQSSVTDALKRLREQSTAVLGVCGGYQMLGERIDDAGGIESPGDSIQGLGWLPLKTDFQRPKVTRRLSATCSHSIPLGGYEIRWGRSRSTKSSDQTWMQSEVHSAEEPLGLERRGVWGTSLHGFLENPVFRRHFLNQIRDYVGNAPVDRSGDQNDVIDSWADHVSNHVNMDRLGSIVTSEPSAAVPS